MQNVANGILSLPDESLLNIFQHLYMNDCVSVLMSCERFHNIMNTHVFGKMENIVSTGHNIRDGIKTAYNLIDNIDKKGFKLSIELNNFFDIEDICYKISIDPNQINRIQPICVRSS